MSEDQNRTWTDRYMLRLPDGMRDRIKAAAANNNRSMNAEIVATLEEKYPAPKHAPGELMERLLATFQAQPEVFGDGFADALSEFKLNQDDMTPEQKDALAVKVAKALQKLLDIGLLAADASPKSSK